MKKWQLQSSQVPDNQKELFQILLNNRGLETELEQKEFLNPKSPYEWDLASLGFDLSVLDKIKKRLNQAKEKNERVMIFGDYDADGVCSSGILWELLTELGIKATPFIPQRDLHGYGLSVKALEDAFAGSKQPDLLITVDNGIVAHDALNWLSEQRVEVILTDHHQADGEDLPVFALWHSTRVCGAAVAWFLAREILDSKEKLDTLLELAAIATVTDLMQLKGVNRSILSFGLKALKKSKRPGLKALLELSRVKQKELSAYHLGFVIGPRINAMGRLSNSMEALRLVCTKDRGRAIKLAQVLDETNASRKDLTVELLAQAKAAFNEADESPIIIINGDYHEGVIGLVAGSLTEEFLKPSIVIADNGKIAKASARSLPGFNMTEFLRQVKDDLIDVGGHPMAAGFSLLTEKIDLVREKLLALAIKQLDGAVLSPELRIDCQLSRELLKIKTVEAIKDLAPHGNANPRPVFLLKNLLLKNYKTLGAEKQHLKLIASFADGQEEWEILAWYKVDLLNKIKIGDHFSAVVNLDINEWHNKKRLQMFLKDLKIQKKS